jgi:hypothetical protein
MHDADPSAAAPAPPPNDQTPIDVTAIASTAAGACVVTGDARM